MTNMNIDVLNVIPSKTLREYLCAHPVRLSLLQEATIICCYADEEAKLAMFRSLLERAEDERTMRLLTAELYDPEEAMRIYRESFPHNGMFPRYPFLEVCNLPVLFRPGDIIRSQAEFYYVAAVPYLAEGFCDFTDESYLCYSLATARKIKHMNYNALARIHVHIGICEAVEVSFRRLNSEQKRTALLIRNMIAQKNGRPHVLSKRKARRK